MPAADLLCRGECSGMRSILIPFNFHNAWTNIHRVGHPPLVAAVSEAGGLGMLWAPKLCRKIILLTFCCLFCSGILTALTQPNPDALRKAIRETRKLTSKPFGVNITILPTINPPDYDGFARAAVEEGVRIFETAGSNRKLSSVIAWCITEFPCHQAGPFIKYFKNNGCIVIHKCTTIRHGKVSSDEGSSSSPMREY